jgi:hypothetical protein
MKTEQYFKFLDKTLGGAIVPKRNFGTFKNTTSISLITEKKYVVMTFWYNSNRDNFTLFKNKKVNDIVSGFLGLCENDTEYLLKDWLADKFNLKKVEDLKQFL